MKITFWGVRGTIPTPQSQNLGYGGETSCVEISCGSDRLILDAGSGLRLLGEEMLVREEISAETHILFSHFHWDHIQGLPYFAPLYRDCALRFYSVVPVDELYGHLAAQMSAPFFPLAFDAVRAKRSYSQFAWEKFFEIGPFRILPFPLHHPQGCTGFRIECAGKTVVYATDHEHGNAASDAILLKHARGADYLITDAQYTPEEYVQRRGFGHSTWRDAAELAQKAEVRQLVLFHHDPLRSDKALKTIVDGARSIFPNVDAAREHTTIDLEG